MYANNAFASQKALIAAKAQRAHDFTSQRVRRGGQIDQAPRSKNRNKSKVRYHGLANIYLARRRLMA